MQLELIWRTWSGGGGRTEQMYLDFVIDGQSLGETLKCGDMIGCLGWGWPEYEADSANVLLLQRASLLETDRAMIYVCRECGDIGCGAITAQVEEVEGLIIWRDFGYENNYDPLTPDLKEYAEVGPFLFDKTRYQQTLMQRWDQGFC